MTETVKYQKLFASHVQTFKLVRHELCILHGTMAGK